MTRLLIFVIGLAIGALLTGFLCKRRSVQATVTPASEDRFDLAGMPNRFKQYDREYRLGRKNGK